MTTPAATPSVLRDRRRAQRRLRRRRLVSTLVVASLAAAAGGAWWWFEGRPRTAEAVAGPTYLTVTPRPYAATVPAPGTLRAATTAEVRVQGGGNVVWTAALGARVAAGDVVARLDTVDLERDARDAELALERAQRALTASRSDRADVERSLALALDDAGRKLARARDGATDAAAKLDLIRRLAILGSASPRELGDAETAAASALEEVATAERAVATAHSDLATRVARAERDLADAVAAVEQAVVKLDRAREALAAAELRAPIAGVVAEVRIAAGGFVGSNGAVLTVADDRSLELLAQVDETEISQIAVGQTARVTVLAVGERSFPARVANVSPVARTSQNIPVFEIVLAIDNADGTLRPGMTGEAEVVVRQEEDTVTLPAAAVTRNPRGDGVVTVRIDDETTERRQVQVLATVGASLVVRGDLPAGTQVEVPAATAAATSTAPNATLVPGAPPSGLPAGLIPGANPGGSGGGAGRMGGGGGGQ